MSTVSDLIDLMQGKEHARFLDILTSLTRHTAVLNACIIVADATGHGNIVVWQSERDDNNRRCLVKPLQGLEHSVVLFPGMHAQSGVAMPCYVHADATFYLTALTDDDSFSEQDHVLLGLSADHLTTLLTSLSHSHDQQIASLEDKLSLFDEVSGMSSTGGWDYDTRTRDIHWTKETYRLFEFAPEQNITLFRILSGFPSHARGTLIHALRELLNDGKNYHLELPVVTRSKQHKWVRLSGKALKRKNRVSRIFGSIQDITEQKRLSDTEQNYIEYLNTILDSMNDAVLTVDEHGTIVTANLTVEALFGHAPEQLLGEDISVIMSGAQSQKHLDYLRSHLRPGIGALYNKEMIAMHANGKNFPVELSISEVKQSGQTQFVCVVKDITERKQAQDSIYQIAFFDEITHLPNIKSFEKDLRKLLAKGATAGGQLYCCMMDIDNFAQFNMSFGKDTGDYILRIFAGRLEKALSSRFQAYSGLGDRFYILYKDPFDEATDKSVLDLIDAVEWNIHSELSKEFSLHGHLQVVTTSLASTYIHALDATYEKVIGILDFGSERAKKQGLGGRVTLERSELNAYDRHNYISQSFTQAMEDGEFYIVLQPQYDKHGNILSSEALLRWQEKRLGNVSPGEFIPIAEESDAVVDIGYWVINEACRLLSEMKHEGLDTSISVNISGKHIVRPDFHERLIDIVDEWQIMPHQLVLEITETTLVSSIDLVRKRIERLSQMGFAFSIDDFGTGYSSLSYLKELPIIELKIDRYFVDEINFESDDVPIVNMIIDMAGAMGVRTVAEGIENEIQLQYLINKGCDIFQGFHLARPMREEDWRSAVLTRRYKLHSL